LLLLQRVAAVQQQLWWVRVPVLHLLPLAWSRTPPTGRNTTLLYNIFIGMKDKNFLQVSAQTLGQEKEKKTTYFAVVSTAPPPLHSLIR
jgi:hypothetical protein